MASCCGMLLRNGQASQGDFSRNQLIYNGFHVAFLLRKTKPARRRAEGGVKSCLSGRLAAG